MEVSTLPLPPTLRSAVLTAGYRTVGALAHAEPDQLANALGTDAPTAAQVRAVAQSRVDGGPALAGARSARALLDRERSTGRVITFCAALDGVLGGGVPLGQVTELCGGPGVGKTQLWGSMQLSLDVQIPGAFGGLGGQALYIDTEGGLCPDRLAGMARALSVHLARVARSKGDDTRAAAAAATTARVLLDGVHYCRVHDLGTQLAVIDGLDAMLAARPGVRLVVLDSLAFCLRQSHADPATRSRQLARIGQALTSTASKHGIAVVLTNHVTVRPGSEGAPARLVPALGETWAHAPASRLMLYWDDGARRAFLFKSASRPAAAAEFSVVAEGVRGARAQPPAAKRGRE